MFHRYVKLPEGHPHQWEEASMCFKQKWFDVILCNSGETWGIYRPVLVNNNFFNQHKERILQCRQQPLKTGSMGTRWNWWRLVAWFNNDGLQTGNQASSESSVHIQHPPGNPDALKRKFHHLESIKSLSDWGNGIDHQHIPWKSSLWGSSRCRKWLGKLK